MFVIYIMATRKRKLEWDISEAEVSNAATVHGIIMQLSPIWTSRKNPNVKYFDGKISDGKKS